MPSIGKCVSVRHASHRRGDPPPGTSRAFASCPALSFERRCDAALVRGPDPGEVDAQTVAGNLQNGRASGVLAQFVPAPGHDGHFVAYFVPAAHAQIGAFCENLAADPGGRVPAP